MCQASMERSIYKASMSYETARMYKTNTEKVVYKYITKEQLTILRSYYMILNKQEIRFPFKSGGSNFKIKLSDSEQSIMFNMEY